MQRCLQLAKKGIGTTRPNPSVGAVVVYKDTIIGEGFTSPYGGAHAEVNAIQSVKDTSVLSKATLYVTLEPCAHFGKTPPCADLIVHHQFKKVVIGCLDIHSVVSGKGVQKLMAAGIDVHIGVLEQACLEHHKRFFKVHHAQRPYVILKWAETKDGFIAPLQKERQEPVWISNPYAQQLVHKWRAQEHAILVGANTVLADNPSLTVRSWKGENPVRIVVAKKGSLSSDAKVFDADAKTILLTDEQQDMPAHVLQKELKFNEPLAAQICSLLYKCQIQSVLIEGGAKTLQCFIDEGVFDEARVFVGATSFGEGVPAPKLIDYSYTQEDVQGDVLKHYVHD